MRRFVFFLVAALLLTVPSPIRAEERETVFMEEPSYLYLNLWHKRIDLTRADGEVIASYPIAAGARDTPSPMGMYQVIQKSEDWGGGFGSRWLGLNVEWGMYGIHGTNRPEFVGRNVSHGCFRMKNRDIEKLYPFVKVGMPVVIDGPVTGHERITYRILVNGSRGTLVKLVQNRLKAAGYYEGKCNGIFDRHTEKAVIRFQQSEGRPVTGQIGYEDLIHLGIIE